MVESLKERGLLENTLIIFTSDNGGLIDSESVGHHASGPLRGHKATIYEGGHRIPMIMRWDGVIPKGERRDKLIGLNDVYATLCDIVGIDVPVGQAIDSISFMDYIIDERSSSRASRDSIGVWLDTKDLGREESFRQRNMKLIRRNARPYYELYDLDKDLFETNDLSSDEKYQPLMKDMLQNLKKVGPCANESDKIGQFFIKRKNRKQRVDCAWFAKRRKRCMKFNKRGLKKCPDSCVSSCQEDISWNEAWWDET